jgi:hypothetical protein
MERASSLLCRHTVVAAVMIIFGSCSAPTEPAEVASGDQPAQVAASGGQPAQVMVLAGDLARQLAAYNPPTGHPVLVAGTEGNKEGIVFVFDESMEEAEHLLERLIVPGDVPDCVREGPVVCCDPTTETFVVNTARGWIRLGERCKALPPEEGNTDDDPERPAVDFEEVSPELWNALANRGVGHPFMTLPKADGEPRVLEAPSLANAPPQSGELSPPLMQRLAPGANLPIILAGHAGGTACPNNCCDTIAFCKKSDTGLRCGTARKHWYQWKSAQQQWCETSSCTC